jgi:DNA-binding beta-propeller fold protein YncE
MRALLCIAIAALAVAGCGRADRGSVPLSGDYKLYAATSTQSAELVTVIDTRSHSIERTLPSGTPSPDWAHLYSVQGTALLDLDPHTGAARHTMHLPGPFLLPSATIGGLPGGLSQNGRWLVLQAFDNRDTGLPTATQTLVVDTSYKTAAKRIDMTGYLQFDAVSNDGQRIYLVEYLSAKSYRVRVLSVRTGQLDPTIVVDKTDGNAAMAGLRLSGVASRDGHWLYSMYIRENQGAFIHALNLDGNIAICIDLAGPGYASSHDVFQWSLALSADGSRLYAANGAMGVIAELDTSNGGPNLTRTIHIDTPKQSAGILVPDVEAKGFGANGAVVSPDGQALVISGSSGVVWLDTASLRATGRQLTGWSVWSLAMSPNGSNLYAVNDSGMIAEMSMTGSHEASTFAGGPGQPMALIRVEAVQAP